MHNADEPGRDQDEPLPAQPAQGPEVPLPVGQRWWFSPMMMVVAGGAVAAFQWGPVSGGTANWLNWLVAAAGIGVLVFGAAWFVRESRRR